MREDGAYLGEGDGDAGVQLNVVGQLCELVLLLLERLQQAADLLLGQHNSAVVLRRGTRRYRHERCCRGSILNAHCTSYLLECFFTVQAGGGHLRQQDGHVLLLLPQPDQPLPDVGVHHAQRHLLLPTKRLVEVCEVSPDAGARALCRAGDLRGGRDQLLLSGEKQQRCTFLIQKGLTCSVCAMPTPSSTICSPPSIC